MGGRMEGRKDGRGEGRGGWKEGKVGRREGWKGEGWKDGRLGKGGRLEGGRLEGEGRMEGGRMEGWKGKVGRMGTACAVGVMGQRLVRSAHPTGAMAPYHFATGLTGKSGRKLVLDGVRRGFVATCNTDAFCNSEGCTNAWARGGAQKKLVLRPSRRRGRREFQFPTGHTVGGNSDSRPVARRRREFQFPTGHTVGGNSNSRPSHTVGGNSNSRPSAP